MNAVLDADNFQPESVDMTKPGTLVTQKGGEKTAVTVERAIDPVRGSTGAFRYSGLADVLIGTYAWCYR